MLNFCTLFDSVYLSRGMAMYESLQKHCNNFHLYVFAFDDACYRFFNSNKLPNITIISLQEFEDEELLAAKKTRSRGEYCWTCTPSTIRYILNHYHVDSCTYIDADLYFFSSPQVLINEIGDNSVMITEHRYTKEYDQTNTSGKYCVQFVLFKNDKRGQIVLEWWRNACLEWCYNRMEDGKFGDQKYLDDWCTRFEGVHELQHLGGGVAPWNMQQYTFFKEEGKTYGTEIASQSTFDVIFFHFHSLAFKSRHLFFFAPYYRRNGKSIYKYIFIPYIRQILLIRKKYTYIAQNETYQTEKIHAHYPFIERLYSICNFLLSKNKI